MKKKTIFTYLSFLALLCLIGGLTYVLNVYGAEQVVSFIGFENSYLIFFLVASFGGVSTFTSASFYTSLYTFASGGLDPFLLGLLGGLGISIGDSFFYYLGHKGRSISSGWFEKWVKRISDWLKDKPLWQVRLFVFFYIGFTPLPNDVLMVSMGLLSYRYRQIIAVLLLANIFLTTILALFST